MIENRVTLAGNVVAEPRLKCLADGTFTASFRMAATPRWFDRGSGAWREGDTVFVTVNCWRTLAGNVGDSVRKGDPVLVTGRLTARAWATPEGERRSVLEIEAASVGHDLNRVVTTVSRSRRAVARAADSEAMDQAGRGAPLADEEPGGHAPDAQGAPAGAPDAPPPFGSDSADPWPGVAAAEDQAPDPSAPADAGTAQDAPADAAIAQDAPATDRPSRRARASAA